jgi:hypothetical protein
MTKPLIQIDDIGTTREMTDEEFEAYEALIADVQPLPYVD